MSDTNGGTFGARVKRRRLQLDLSQAEVAKRTGGALSQTTIANIESGRNQATTELVALAAALDCYPEDLDPRAGSVRESRPAYPGAVSRDRDSCPFLPWESLMNIAAFSREEIAAMSTRTYPSPEGHGTRTFCFEAPGISMESQTGLSIPSGHVVFIDPDRPPMPNGQDLDSCVLVRSKDRRTVLLRQLIEDQGRRFMKALNPAWPERIVSLDGFEICGTVIGIGRFVSGNNK